MMLLLLFWFPLIFVASISGIEEKSFHRLSYCSGMVIGGIVFALIAFFMPPSISYTDTLMQYWRYCFLSDAVVPLLCLLLCYIPASCFSSHRSCAAGSSFILGLLTIKIYAYLFAMSNNPKLFPLAFILLIYTCAIIIFKAASVFPLHFSLPVISGYLFGSISFILVCAVGFFGSALWYFNESIIGYSAIFFLLVGLAAAAGIIGALFSSRQ